MAQYRDSLTNFSINVGEILNPALFWGHKSCRDNRDLDDLESQLTSTFRDADYSQFQSQGCLVAVENPKTKGWVRARVIEVSGAEEPVAKVFLVDYGVFLSDVRLMHPLPTWALKMWPQAILFQLRGIIPAQGVFDEELNQTVWRKSYKWVLAAENTVRMMLRKGPCHFYWSQGQLTHAIGDVFLHIPNQHRTTHSLSKFLTDQNYAISDSELFHKEHVVEAVALVANLREGFHGPEIFPVFPTSPQVRGRSNSNGIEGQRLSHNGLGLPTAHPHSTNSGLADQFDCSGEKQRLSTALQAYYNKMDTGNAESANSDFWGTSKARKKKEAEMEAERLNVNIDESQLSKQLSDMKFSDSNGGNSKGLVNFLVNMKNPHLPVLVLNFQQKPLTLLSSAPFVTDVIRILEKAGFVTLTNIQKYMWPSICRGRSVIAVGNSDTGKTVGFLAPLASILLDQSRSKTDQSLFGPLALVLCSSSMKAEGLEANLKQLVASNKFANPNANRFKPAESRVKIILRNGEQDPSRAALELFNGCHVLVTTPSVFKSLNGFYQGMSIDLTKLSLVVLDDADILIEKYQEEVEEILEMCREERDSRENEVDIQLVLTSRKWHPMLEKWAGGICQDKPVTIVSAGFEFLVYGRVLPSITVVSGASRMQQAVDFVQKRQGKASILISCVENEEALQLGSKLQTLCGNNLIVAENSEEKGKIQASKKKWLELSSAGLGPVLVASDDVLPSLAISDADILLHHSIPLSKYRYILRISSLFDSIALNRKKRPEMHLFLDVDCDERYILPLYDFQTRVNAPVPEELKVKAEAIRKRKESEKSLRPVCAKVCAFGVCAEMDLCADRHVLDQMDVPAAYLPKSGEVKVQVSHMHDASHFSVRVVEHTDDDGKVIEVSSEQHIGLAMDIDEHFGREENRDDLPEVEPPQIEAPEVEPFQIDPPEVELPKVELLQADPRKDEMSHVDPSEQKSKSASGGHGLQLQEVSGDLFNCPDSLVHCVAQDFYMGGGIAVQFKEKFGNRELLVQQNKKVGQVAHLSCHGRFIFCLVTKKTSRYCSPRLVDIRCCLQELRRLCEGLRIGRLAMPRICCGKDRYDWNVIRSEIESVFGDLDIAITVFHVSNAEGNDRTNYSRRVMNSRCNSEDLHQPDRSRSRNKPSPGPKCNRPVELATGKGQSPRAQPHEPQQVSPKKRHSRIMPPSPEKSEDIEQVPPKKMHPRIMPPSLEKSDCFKDLNQMQRRTEILQQDTTGSSLVLEKICRPVVENKIVESAIAQTTVQGPSKNFVRKRFTF